MKRSLTVFTGIMLGVFILAGQYRATNAESSPEKRRSLTVKQMMKGLVKPHKAALETALVEPPGDVAWEALALDAALLNESGYILMDDGRCPDRVWADSCKTLRDASVVLQAALEKKDFEASRAAFQKLAGACASCHKANKK